MTDLANPHNFAVTVPIVVTNQPTMADVLRTVIEHELVLERSDVPLPYTPTVNFESTATVQPGDEVTVTWNGTGWYAMVESSFDRQSVEPNRISDNVSAVLVRGEDDYSRN